MNTSANFPISEHALANFPLILHSPVLDLLESTNLTTLREEVSGEAFSLQSAKQT